MKMAGHYHEARGNDLWPDSDTQKLFFLSYITTNDLFLDLVFAILSLLSFFMKNELRIYRFTEEVIINGASP
jgi:hypothetical protein